MSRDVGSPSTALPTQRKRFGWLISDQVDAGEERVRFFISTAQVQEKDEEAQKVEGLPSRAETRGPD